jgi:hypothetical protein
MLTQVEFDQVQAAVKNHTASRPVLRAREIIATYFSSPTAMGMLRMREHSLFTTRMDVTMLIGALLDLFK